MSLLCAPEVNREGFNCLQTKFQDHSAPVPDKIRELRTLSDGLGKIYNDGGTLGEEQQEEFLESVVCAAWGIEGRDKLEIARFINESDMFRTIANNFYISNSKVLTRIVHGLFSNIEDADRFEMLTILEKEGFMQNVVEKNMNPVDVQSLFADFIRVLPDDQLNRFGESATYHAGTRKYPAILSALQTFNQQVPALVA